MFISINEFIEAIKAWDTDGIRRHMYSLLCKVIIHRPQFKPNLWFKIRVNILKTAHLSPTILHIHNAISKYKLPASQFYPAFYNYHHEILKITANVYYNSLNEIISYSTFIKMH